MSHPHSAAGAAAHNSTTSMSYVPPYRADAHTYISEQLAHAQAHVPDESPDPTAPPPPPPGLPARSPSASPPSLADGQSTTTAPGVPAAFNPLSTLPPPYKYALAAAPSLARAPLLSPSSAVETAPATTKPAALAFSVPSPIAPLSRPPSQQVPFPLNMSSPAQGTPFISAPVSLQIKPIPPPSPQPSIAATASAAATCNTYNPNLSQSHVQLSSPFPAVLYTACIPELRVILARGRLSGVRDFGPNATGEDIYRAFCPGGDTYPNDNASGSAAAVAAATTGTCFNTNPSPSLAESSLDASQSPPTLSMAKTLTSDEGKVEVPLCSSDGVATAAGSSVAAVLSTRGRLPPGWERRVFHNCTFYLDHISREAHEQEPWVVWWSRAGNVDADANNA